jgi:hypothetical protein
VLINRQLLTRWHWHFDTPAFVPHCRLAKYVFALNYLCPSHPHLPLGMVIATVITNEMINSREARPLKEQDRTNCARVTKVLLIVSLLPAAPITQGFAREQGGIESLHDYA